MLVKKSNQVYQFIKQTDFKTDTDYYRYILKQKYRTSFNQQVDTKQRIIRFTT